MARCSFAVQKILPENGSQSRIDPDQAILHSAVDSVAATSLYPYFKRVDVSVESHFFVRLNGEIEQYMDTNVRADANLDANARAISIETEDDGNPNERPWTSEQVTAIIRLLNWICDTHPKVLRRQCPAWDQAGIGWHVMWGAPSPWTPVKGKTCPGTIRIPQARDIIRRVATVVTAVTEDEEDMKAYIATIIDDSGTAKGWHLVAQDFAHRVWVPRIGDVGRFERAGHPSITITEAQLGEIPERKVEAAR